MAFDPDGRLWVADVGQNRWEEVHVLAAARGGVNLGWNLMEGTHRFTRSPFEAAALDRPVLEYSHRDGCSITGGVVYRGAAIPRLRGHYLFADYCRRWIRSIRVEDGRVTERREWLSDAAPSIVSFGTDAAGEVYAVSHRGTVYRLVPAP
jgi:hypothetical protein